MYGAVASNKRNTLFIMALFVGLIGAIGWVISYVYADVDIAYWILGIALAYALLQYFIASKLAVAMTGAQQIEKKDNPRLYNIVENVAITYGLQTPAVYIVDDAAPNAFATGRDPKHAIVAVTTGLLAIMSDRELGAVIAHEVGHVKNYDIRVSTITFGLVSAIGLLTDIILRMMFFGGDRRNNNQNPIMLVAGILLLVLSPIIALMIQLAVSRQREYLADATGALTIRDPDGLISALQKLEQFGRPMKRQNSSTSHLFISDPLKPGLLSRLFSTHPPLEERIKRLQKTAGTF